MKIISVKQLEIPGVKVIRFERHMDARGYFTEMLRQSDINENDDLKFLRENNFVQISEGYSKAGVIRGLHFQWQPSLGKLLRVVSGHMVDMILDVRKNSPTEGKIILYDMPNLPSDDYSEWLWLPPGLAHGSFFLKDSVVEYLFTAYYNANGESGVSPLAKDIDWSICDPSLKEKFMSLISGNMIISDKDKNAQSFSSWQNDVRSNNILYV